MSIDWPQLDYLSWRETCSALHLYSQIAGKYRLAHTPWLNHSWHATFYVTPRGLTSSLIPDVPGIEFQFDFQEHEVRGKSGDDRKASVKLGPSTVAAFHANFIQLVSNLGGTPTFDGQPNEVPFPMPFREDHRDRAGAPSGPVAATGIDVARFERGHIRSLHVFLDPPGGESTTAGRPPEAGA